MTTVVHEQYLDVSVSREVLIGRLRAALNAAESGEDVVILELGDVEVDIDLETNELLVYALPKQAHPKGDGSCTFTF